MPAYKILKEKEITRNAGDDTEVAFVLPVLFDVANVNVRFTVDDRSGQQLYKIEKVNMQVTGQRVAVPIAKHVFKVPGRFRWTLKVIQGGEITVGKGDFIAV